MGYKTQPKTLPFSQLHYPRTHQSIMQKKAFLIK